MNAHSTSKAYLTGLKLLWQGNAQESSSHFSRLANKPFPFADTQLTRKTARQWLQKHARGQQRAGLVASSGAIRLRADGLELSSGFRQGNREIYVNWFCHAITRQTKFRSSKSTRSRSIRVWQCQGLELDCSLVFAGGGDFSYDTWQQATKCQQMGVRLCILVDAVDV